MKRGPFTLAHFPEWEQTTISLLTFALWEREG